jgi:hypothetical protein
MWTLMEFFDRACCRSRLSEMRKLGLARGGVSDVRVRRYKLLSEAQYRYGVAAPGNEPLILV